MLFGIAEVGAMGRRDCPGSGFARRGTIAISQTS